MHFLAHYHYHMSWDTLQRGVPDTKIQCFLAKFLCFPTIINFYCFANNFWLRHAISLIFASFFLKLSIFLGNVQKLFLILKKFFLILRLSIYQEKLSISVFIKIKQSSLLILQAFVDLQINTRIYRNYGTLINQKV